MRRGAPPALVALLLGACASFATRDPLQVTVAGVEPLPGEGLELRLLVEMRVQNPNDVPVDYDGVYVKLEVQGSTFATGVSDVAGSVPRFGEATIAVPVTVSALRMARQVLGVLDGEPVDRISFVLDGKLSGPGFAAERFQSQGEFKMPGAAQGR